MVSNWADDPAAEVVLIAAVSTSKILRLFDSGVSYVCKFLKQQNISSVFFVSPNLGSIGTTSSFSHSITKKAPVVTNYG